MENPTGTDETERKAVKIQSTKAYEDMKAHILKSRKFRGHPILNELAGQPVKEEPKTTQTEDKKEAKKTNGKKSKR